MTALSSFEVLAESLVPQGVLAIANPPYVLQAYFVQVSYPETAGTTPIQFDLTFEETTGFRQGAGRDALVAQFIDENGDANKYPNTSFFGSEQTNGFKAQEIAPGQTKIYSVTAFPMSAAGSAGLEESIPQAGTGWRGTASLNPNTTNLLVATPTQRQIYMSSDMKTVIDSAVYPVPTISGKTLI